MIMKQPVYFNSVEGRPSLFPNVLLKKDIHIHTLHKQKKKVASSAPGGPDKLLVPEVTILIQKEKI